MLGALLPLSSILWMWGAGSRAPNSSGLGRGGSGLPAPSPWDPNLPALKYLGSKWGGRRENPDDTRFFSNNYRNSVRSELALWESNTSTAPSSAGSVLLFDRANLCIPIVDKSYQLLGPLHPTGDFPLGIYIVEGSKRHNNLEGVVLGDKFGVGTPVYKQLLNLLILEKVKYHTISDKRESLVKGVSRHKYMTDIFSVLTSLKYYKSSWPKVLTNHPSVKFSNQLWDVQNVSSPSPQELENAFVILNGNHCVDKLMWPRRNEREVIKVVDKLLR